MQQTFVLTVPDEVVGTPLEKEYREAAQQVLNEQVVLQLYRERKISTGRGARLLGMSLYDFIQFLGKHRVSIFNYEEGDLEADLAAALAVAPSQGTCQP